LGSGPTPGVNACSTALQEDWEKAYSATLGVICFAKAVFDIFLMRRRCYYNFAWSEHFTWLLFAPGLFGLLHGSSAYLDQTPVKLLWSSLELLNLTLYMFNMLCVDLHQFSNAAGVGFGGINEAIEHAGDMLDDLDLKPMNFNWLSAIYWGRCTMKPSKEFLEGCYKRLQAYALVTFLFLILIQYINDLTGNGYIAPPSVTCLGCYPFLYMGLCQMLCNFMMLSAKFPMQALVKPWNVILGAGNASMRNTQFMIIFLLVNTCGHIVSMFTELWRPECLWWARHSSSINVTIILIAVMMGHRCWVPPFSWTYQTPDTDKGDNAKHLGSAWQMTLEAMNASTGSFRKFVALQWLVKANTMSPDLGAKMYAGEMTVEEARDIKLKEIKELIEQKAMERECLEEGIVPKMGEGDPSDENLYIEDIKRQTAEQTAEVVKV